MMLRAGDRAVKAVALRFASGFRPFVTPSSKAFGTQSRWPLAAARRQRLFSPPTEKNRPNLGNRRLNVPAVYIMPQLGHCQHAPSLPGRADTYPHPLISPMLSAVFLIS